MCVDAGSSWRPWERRRPRPGRVLAGRRRGAQLALPVTGLPARLCQARRRPRDKIVNCVSTNTVTGPPATPRRSCVAPPPPGAEKRRARTTDAPRRLGTPCPRATKTRPRARRRSCRFHRDGLRHARLQLLSTPEWQDPECRRSAVRPTLARTRPLHGPAPATNHTRFVHPSALVRAGGDTSSAGRRTSPHGRAPRRRAPRLGALNAHDARCLRLSSRARRATMRDTRGRHLPFGWRLTAPPPPRRAAAPEAAAPAGRRASQDIDKHGLFQLARLWAYRSCLWIHRGRGAAAARGAAVAAEAAAARPAKRIRVGAVQPGVDPRSVAACSPG